MNYFPTHGGVWIVCLSIQDFEGRKLQPYFEKYGRNITLNEFTYDPHCAKAFFCKEHAEDHKRFLKEQNKDRKLIGEFVVRRVVFEAEV